MLGEPLVNTSTWPHTGALGQIPEDCREALWAPYHHRFWSQVLDMSNQVSDVVCEEVLKALVLNIHNLNLPNEVVLIPTGMICGTPRRSD